MCRKHDVQNAHRRERLPAAKAKQNGRDLTGSQIDGGHDQAIEKQPEIDSAEAPQANGGFAGVAKFIELQIRQNTRSSPQPRIEEDGRYASQREGPPLPVAGHALRPDDVGDKIRRVARERCGYQRNAGQPPRNRPSRGKEFRGACP